MTIDERCEELLVVCVKYPEAGRVKTRLAAGIGEDQALEAYQELVAGTLAAAGAWLRSGRGLGEDGEKREVWLYFDPAEKASAVREWLEAMAGEWETEPRWVAQPDGDLGKRLQTVFGQGFTCGFHSVCAIGTDCPELTVSGLEDAFAVLRCEAGVVGPTRDGGYYLIGIKSQCEALFSNIPWSSPTTLEATYEAARRSGLRLQALPVLMDVDTEADWRRWQEGKAEAERGNLKKAREPEKFLNGS